MSLSRGFAVRPSVAVGLTAVVAFFIRLLHVVSYDTAPTNDMSVYVDMAVHRLALANLFTAEGICWFPPGYAVFLKPFFLVFHHEAALRAVQVAQAALGAWTCVLISRLARRLHSRRAGIAAAVMTCFFPHYLFYSSAHMSENLFIPLYVASLLLFLRVLRRPSAWALYRAGVLAGAATLVRPVAVSLAPAALAAAWAVGATARPRGRALLIIVLGGLTLIGPWAARNWIAYDRLVLIAPNGAFNLLVGNHAEATGRYTEPPSIAGNLWKRIDDFRNRTFVFVTQDPMGALYVVMRLKWAAFWELIQPWPLYSSNPKLYYGEHFFPFLSWRWTIFLGSVGLGVLLVRMRPGWWLAPVCLASYIGFYMIYFGGSRFRMPAEAYFLAWGGGAVAAAAGIVPRLRRLRAPTWGAAAAILLAVILAEAGIAAVPARAALRSEETVIAQGEQFPVLTSKPSIPFFGGKPIPLDRSRGRYLRMAFTVYRQGPHRDAPNNGLVKLTYLDSSGRSLPWLESAAFYMEAIPAGRWVTVAFRRPIPPQAAFCTVAVIPDKGSPDTLIVDQPILRYARGNELALEFTFPYLRYEE